MHRGRLASLSCELVESLGVDRLIHTRIGAQDLILRTGDDVDQPPPGSALGVDFPAAAIHWFDARSGQRIASS